MVSEQLVEKVARSLYEQYASEVGGVPLWADVEAFRRDAYARDARAALAVVEAERGWEYCVRTERRGHVPCDSEHTAVRVAARDREAGLYCVPMRRHPASVWEAVSDGE